MRADRKQHSCTIATLIKENNKSDNFQSSLHGQKNKNVIFGYKNMGDGKKTGDTKFSGEFSHLVSIC